MTVGVEQAERAAPVDIVRRPEAARAATERLGALDDVVKDQRGTQCHERQTEASETQREHGQNHRHPSRKRRTHQHPGHHRKAEVVCELRCREGADSGQAGLSQGQLAPHAGDQSDERKRVEKARP